jgi:microcystin degradation protein MlrC
MPLRIALLGIYHESNTFLDKPTTLSDFRKGHWLFGNDIIREYKDAYHEIGGMKEVLDQEGIELVPVMYAQATPGGIITAETYNDLLQKMMERLKSILPVDGCLVVPHGAAVSEIFADMDGYWLSL